MSLVETDGLKAIMKIVLVEDESVLLRTFHHILETAGHSVRDARDGETAWRLCEEEAPDLVITDVVMPGMDGAELAKRVRKNFKEVGILLISAACSPDYVADAMQLGHVAFLAKPVDSAQLLEGIEQVSH